MYFNEDTDGRMMYDLVVESYDLARPSYPAAAIDEIFCRFSEKPKTLEIGSGSGQATTDLECRSLSVDCVEPGANFARHLRSKYVAKSGVTVYECDFEDFEGRGPYDLIFSGCALHWVPKDVALEKSADLLGESGWLAAIWNQMDVEPKIIKILNETLVPSMPDFVLPVFGEDVRGHFAAGVRDLCDSYKFQNCFMQIYEEPTSLSLSEFVDLVKSYSDVDGWDSSEVDAIFARLRNSLRAAGCQTIEIHNYFPMALAMKKSQ